MLYGWKSTLGTEIVNLVVRFFHKPIRYHQQQRDTSIADSQRPERSGSACSRKARRQLGFARQINEPNEQADAKIMPLIVYIW